VPAGQLDPDHIHTPGIFVKRMIALPPTYEKLIENRTVRPRAAAAAAGTDATA
jgi:3-oxoacid CoA-transferase subunit A